tara:strand:- start:166 stop:405 length:240 start_codon:yes stop_codon:yes gene_type:complete
MEGLLIIGALFCLTASTLTYVYLIETNKILPHQLHTDHQVERRKQLNEGNYWDYKTKQYYKWDALVAVHEARSKANDTI